MNRHILMEGIQMTKMYKKNALHHISSGNANQNNDDLYHLTPKGLAQRMKTTVWCGCRKNAPSSISGGYVNVFNPFGKQYEHVSKMQN